MKTLVKNVVLQTKLFTITFQQTDFISKCEWTNHWKVEEKPNSLTLLSSPTENNL